MSETASTDSDTEDMIVYDWDVSGVPIMDVAQLSEKQRERRLRFERLYLDCTTRGSICPCQMQSCSGFPKETSLRPNSRNCKKLQSLLLQDDYIQNPYIKWSREDLQTALIKRHVALPEESSRFQLRIALESADTRRQFPFLRLPKDVRVIVYDHALRFGTVEMSNPPLLVVNRQIREEATATYLHINRFILSCAIPPEVNTSSTDFQIDRWLKLVNTERVAGLRQILIRMGPENQGIEIDLTCSDANGWMVIRDCFGRPNCPTKIHKKFRESVKESVNHSFQQAAPLEATQEGVERLLKRHDNHLKTSKRKAQESMDEFVETCGKGKGVRPTVRGIEILRRAVGTILWDIDSIAA